MSPSMFPERAVAEATRVPLGEAARSFERARTIDAVPELALVLAAGETTAHHVDVVTRAWRDLNSEQRRRLAERGDVLEAAASMLPRDEFACTVRNEVRRVCAADGAARLDRQERATRLRTWIDGATGMWCLHGEHDPETGLILDRQLQTMLDRLFHDRTPDTAPTDPVAKQQHLRALALGALCNGDAGKVRTELTVLIDARTLTVGEHDDTHIDLGADFDLPVETIRRMACCADIIVPVITAANGINLHLGRARRLASPDQVRALRAMYQCCAIPGCPTRFDKTQIHHVKFFGKHNGGTDIDDELPLCHQHHHRVHEGGWQLTLDQHRNLTITYPDGTTMTTGPPRRRPR
ncbi:MAG TPA: HNH endonuclease [Ilumatobacteraceae bacterium]|nr:HNH endonuclease [Ilumatobacteraceae bacterium]